MRRGFAAARLVVGLLIAAAVVAQLRSTLEYAGRDGDRQTGAVVQNFFSYFTIDSNSLSVLLLLTGAVLLLRRPGDDPAWFTTARLCVTTYMVLTGIVYNLLLRGIPVTEATVAWSNEVLHVVGPVYLLVDWWLAPGRGAVAWRRLPAALAFPVVWAAYTLVRGPWASDPFRDVGHWYPYPFLNPYTSAGGYLSVAAYVVAIAVLTTGTAAALVRLSQRDATPVGAAPPVTPA